MRAKSGPLRSNSVHAPIVESQLKLKWSAQQTPPPDPTTTPLSAEELFNVLELCRLAEQSKELKDLTPGTEVHVWFLNDSAQGKVWQEYRAKLLDKTDDFTWRAQWFKHGKLQADDRISFTPTTVPWCHRREMKGFVAEHESFLKNVNDEWLLDADEPQT